MRNQNFVSVAVIGVIIILLGIVGYFVITKKAPKVEEQPVLGIVIEQPTTNQTVLIPLIVKGYINGNGWSAFEGVAGSVQIFDANNKAVSQRIPLQATTEWMQPIVHFQVTIGQEQMASAITTGTGVLVFRSEEAKDEADVKEFRVPVTFANAQASNWKTYSSTKFGFSFDYPPTWQVTEKTDTKGHPYVDLSSAIYPEPQLPTTPSEEIKFSVVDKNYFNPGIGTKIGLIKYDSSRKALVDDYSASSKCLAPTPILNGRKAPIGFLYDGSLMSDPAHSDYAVLTENGKIILITEYTESAPDSVINSRIAVSFTLLGDNSIFIPDCAGNDPGLFIDSVKTVTIPNDGRDQSTLSGSGFSSSSVAFLYKNGVRQNAAGILPTSVSSDGKQIVFILPFDVDSTDNIMRVQDGASMSNSVELVLPPANG